MKITLVRNNRTIIAIEAAVRGGSVALIRDQHIEASWHGVESVSRAEDLLLNLDHLLKTGRIEKRSIDLVAVSNGPGSYTGIRIGIATAMGLAASLNIASVGVSLMEALMIRYHRNRGGIVVVPTGRTDFCWQRFNIVGNSTVTGSPATGTFDEFTRQAKEFGDVDLLLHHDVYVRLSSMEEFSSLDSRAYDCGSDLAASIGLAARIIGSEVNPMYIRNTQISSGIF